MVYESNRSNHYRLTLTYDQLSEICEAMSDNQRANLSSGERLALKEAAWRLRDIPKRFKKCFSEEGSV